MKTPTDLQDFLAADLPEEVIAQAKRCLLDLLGVAAGGTETRLSGIIRDHAVEGFGGAVPILFDARTASAPGAALAGGMTIDALDAHDGFNPAKGHAGCGLLPALLALYRLAGRTDGRSFLQDLAKGYEVACRVALTQHATCQDYHTSGAWVAVAVAAIGARVLGLGADQTAHAMGVAEYHGPRSQMMRVIDHPTMLKDGSGWGAMAGVSAILLARQGFTGAPALTVAGPHWADLGQRWLIHEQYFKPYPVCRWAQPPIEAALALQRGHGIAAGEIAKIAIHSFHECCRLATNAPETTEEAQYSTSFPTAIALARGGVTPADVADDALWDPEIRRLSAAMEMFEDDEANAAFPGVRMARATLTLADGREVSGRWHRARWDSDSPPSDAELREKFDAYAGPVLGTERAASVAKAIEQIEITGLTPLEKALYAPIS